jgi:inositol phosphorylceramide mannosyltransferase catalytic subunit
LIPKIIHQTWKNDNVPRMWSRLQAKVKSLHPDWEYRLWTDKENRTFVEQEFPEFIETYDGLAKNIMRADVIRYLIMYKLGGLYLDLDYEMLKPFDLIDHDIVLPYSRNVELGDSSDMVGNCIFASAPGHDFWRIVIDDLTENPPKRDNPDVEKSTGPAYLTRIFHEVCRDSGICIHAPKKTAFHPVEPENQKQYHKLCEENIAYGIHHCTATWRGFGSYTDIKAKIRGLLMRFSFKGI